MEYQLEYTTIIYEVTDRVATLIFNRPEVNNGFNVPMCKEILDAIERVKMDDSVHVLVIKANGKVFSVGGDLIEMKRAVEENDQESLVEIAELVMQISFAMKKLPKPVVMVTNGAVAGAAFNMVLAADICIASTESRFIQAFVNVGLAPDAGGMYLLTRSIGMNRAIQLAMTGEAVTAERGKEYGFVYKVCEPEVLDKQVDRLVKRLAKGPELSFKAMKEMVWASVFSGWDEYVKLEVALQSNLGQTDDFAEGVRAFAERRRPNFTGK